MNCSDIRPHLEAFALEALDPLTRTRVENHLQTCAPCRATAENLCDMVGELPLALAHASLLRPPPSLKDNLMHAAQAEVQAHAQTTVIKETFAARADLPAPTAQRGRWLLNPRLWMFSLATSMLVIVALSAFMLMNNMRMEQALAHAQAAQDKVDEIRNQQAMAVPILNSLAAQEIVLTAPDSESAALGKVVIDPTKPTVVFIGYNLPQLPLGQNYVLWTIEKGVMQERGSFTPNQDGFAMVVFLADRDEPLLKQVLVTRQLATDMYPSAERVLVWKANPNDLTEGLSFDSIFARPTVIRPGR